MSLLGQSAAGAAVVVAWASLAAGLLAYLRGQGRDATGWLILAVAWSLLGYAIDII